MYDAIRGGNKEAYAVLFDRYWDKVYRMIYVRVRDADAAEEIAQDIFMKLWDARSELMVRNLSAYLHTWVKHRCLNYLEARLTQRRHWEHYRRFIPQHADSTSEEVGYNDLQRALEEGLRTIPAKSQTVFRLSRMEGRTVKEISEQLNLSEKAIEYHITKSLKELRVYLKEFLVSLLIICQCAH